MGMTTLTGTLTCKTEAEAATVRHYLPDHIRLSRAEPGCLRFNVEQKGDPLVWHLDEAFVDPEAFAAHQARTSTTIWAEKTASIARDFSRIDH